MKTDNSLIYYALVGLTVIVCIKLYLDSDSFNLKCIISNVDGNTYCVREKKNIQATADLLAKVTDKLKKLVNIAYIKYPNLDSVQRLHKRFNPHKISEILPTSKYTAYSENKGEKLAFCTTISKKSDTLIDENTLTFVGIHELSHIMSVSIGHKDEFWKNFKFLLEIAVKNNLYTAIDYKKKPTTYCGMNITDNPYYDY
jgi:hypothetical protein